MRRLTELNDAVTYVDVLDLLLVLLQRSIKFTVPLPPGYGYNCSHFKVRNGTQGWQLTRIRANYW